MTKQVFEYIFKCVTPLREYGNVLRSLLNELSTLCKSAIIDEKKDLPEYLS